MAVPFPSNRIFHPSRELDREHLRHARKCLDEARAVLSLPVPSTFLGKSLHENSDSKKPVAQE